MLRFASHLKLYIGVVGILIALGLLIFFMIIKQEPLPEQEPFTETVIENVPQPTDPRITTIGNSVLERPIEAYDFGTGENHLLFVGGIHGGYEWNSVLLAYELIDHLTENPDIVPDTVTVTIVPSANPDGLAKVIGMEGRFTPEDIPTDEGPVGNGRFNANGVDLNRNFDCKWQPESMWRGNVVSAGTEAFSEPEAVAVRDLVTKLSPEAVVFFHSQSNAVYASECEAGILPETLTLMNTYASAASYPAVDTFDAYTVTGDAEGWLASIGIPAITVELSTHETVEWSKNLSGITALLNRFDAGLGL